MTQEHDEPSLLPCPFCGHGPLLRQIPNDGSWELGCHTVNCIRPKVQTGRVKDQVIAAWNRRQQSGEAVERRPIMLEMAAADDEHRKWERRWHDLQRMYAVERIFEDEDGRWGLRDFLSYAGQVCGYFPPSPTPKTEASEAVVEHIAAILEEWDMKQPPDPFTGHDYRNIARDILTRAALSAAPDAGLVAMLREARGHIAELDGAHRAWGYAEAAERTGDLLTRIDAHLSNTRATLSTKGSGEMSEASILTPKELADELGWLKIAEIIYSNDPVGLASAQARRAKRRARRLALGLFWRRLFKARAAFHTPDQGSDQHERS